MKPLIKYRGGKSKEIPYIEQHIPKFRGKYIEPFFGGGALYFHLEPKRAIINDINTKLMAFYSGVKSDYQNLQKELCEVERIYEINRRQFDALKQKTPNERVEDKNEAFYYQLRDMFNNLATRNIRMLYFIFSSTKPLIRE